ncbi:MAG: hypothetical protein PHO34_02295 [Candidatus Omnitrophica bacterium]|nr:hypothetical protein [Candidatus Omnitrophota bacterium]MDD5500888.1 hypothetical protein [Candidatus Omnitrophota bacterium]
MKCRLESIFSRLYSAFGPQKWWPAESKFEVIVGAILTQNTNWGNVEKAVAALKNKKCLNPGKILALSPVRLGALIKSAGYYNIKASRLKNFLRFFRDRYSSDIKRMHARSLHVLRKELLQVNGIGEETADSILLYALDKPVFVIDAYTKRIFSRHGIVGKDCTYGQAQDIFMRGLKKSVRMFNEYHALLVKLGKDYCHKQNPKCALCPLNGR